jgi:hypothetical protein
VTGHTYATLTAGMFTARIGSVFTAITHTPPPRRRGKAAVASPEFTGGQVVIPTALFADLRQLLAETAAHPFIRYREWDTGRAYLTAHSPAERQFADAEFTAHTAPGTVTLRGALWHFGELDVEHARIGDLSVLASRISVPAAPAAKGRR